MNAHDSLLQYFIGISRGLASDREASRVFQNTTDAGSTREDLMLAFLRNHVPSRCSVVRGGYIFDANGTSSKQIDLIVTNDLTIQFRHFETASGGKALCPIEGANCAISIKTFLDKSTLLDSLQGFASIPPMPDVSVNPLMLNAKELVKHLPLRIIFAFDGINRQTLTSNLQSISLELGIGPDITPDMIIVNRAYSLFRTKDESFIDATGNKIPKNSLYPIELGNPDLTGAFSLLRLITDMQKYSALGSGILFNFEKYNTKLFDHILGNSGSLCR